MAKKKKTLAELKKAAVTRKEEYSLQEVRVMLSYKGRPVRWNVYSASDSDVQIPHRG